MSDIPDFGKTFGQSFNGQMKRLWNIVECDVYLLYAFFIYYLYIFTYTQHATMFRITIHVCTFHPGKGGHDYGSRRGGSTAQETAQPAARSVAT